jgi:hypothetical protein
LKRHYAYKSFIINSLGIEAPGFGPANILWVNDLPQNTLQRSYRFNRTAASRYKTGTPILVLQHRVWALDNAMSGTSRRWRVDDVRSRVRRTALRIEEPAVARGGDTEVSELSLTRPHR